MKEQILERIVLVVLVIICPAIITLLVNGVQDDLNKKIEELDTGKDILIQTDEANILLDVEQYIAGVLPAVVDYNSNDSYIEAQAVAIRTNIYYKMGDKTIINAEDLDYKYFSIGQYIEKWGEDKFKKMQSKYNKAILNTVGKVIEENK